MVKRRTLSDLGYTVSADVLHAIELLQSEYGASSHRDSGHEAEEGGRPTWILELPRFDAEVGVPMNKRDLTLYMRNRTLDGRKLTDLLPADKVVNVYPRDGKPARSIKDSPFLGTAKGNESVRLRLERADLAPLFALFFAAPAPAATPALPVMPAASDPAPSAGPAGRPPIDAEAFEAMLERRSEIGRAGELIAVKDELARLAALGCHEPDRWVERVALADVGRGYDIASTWLGHERCIEVKSSTSAGNAFFITENERRVLGGLGPKAWLYRVVVGFDGAGEVLARVCDPMGILAAAAFVPVVFRVDASALIQAADASALRAA